MVEHETYHRGLCDIKYVPRVVKHVCHSTEERHEPCLVEIFRFYIGLVESHAKLLHFTLSHPKLSARSIKCRRY